MVEIRIIGFPEVCGQFLRRLVGMEQGRGLGLGFLEVEAPKSSLNQDFS